MKTFEASRLSEGNKVFPAKIDIDNFGVTLKIPGLLGGKEKTLSYQQISSVSIDTPMVGYSKITFDTLGFDRIVATGFSKADAQEIKQMVQQGISGARSGGGIHQGGGYSSSPQVIVQETKSAEQIKAEAEANKVRHQIEMEERRIRREEEAKATAERKIKAQKYRDKGQNFIAWLVELNPIYSISLFVWPFLFLLGPGGVKLIGIFALLILVLLVVKDVTKISWKIFGIVILSLLISMVVYVKYTDGASERAKQEQIEKNAELEKIETDIILGIDSGEDKKKLLDLVSQLQFEESSEDVVDNFVEGKKNGIIKTDNTSEEGPDDDFRGTYSEYWTAKREAYKEIIMSGVKIEDYIEKLRKEKQTTIVAPETNKSEEIEFTEAQDEIMVEGIADKVYFYDKPNAESITKGYFVKGQQAKLLGASGDFSKVRFEFNGKVTEKFVQTYQISEINTDSPNESEENVDPEYQ